MAKIEVVTVRLERQPNRRARQRVREAYEHLHEAGRRLGDRKVQEEHHEAGSSRVCAGLDAATGTGSDD